MATRMSFSLTKSAILISGIEGFGLGDGETSDLDCGVADCWVGFDGAGGFANVIVLFDEGAKRSATAAAATSAGVC